MNYQRNTPMSNAQRQRRYRDRNRGGPPQGRWAGHIAVGKRAKIMGTTRTMMFMGCWIAEHTPDVGDAIYCGELRMKPAYERLKAAYDRAIFQVVRHCHENNIDVDCIEIVRDSEGFTFRIDEQIRSAPRGEPG